MNPSHPRFCDWHVFVNPLCADYEFFRITLFIYLGIISLNTFLIFYVLTFRKVVFKDTWHSFSTGLNGSLVLFTWARFAGVIHLALTLSGANRIASAIMYACYVTAMFLSVYNHLSMIIEAIPGLKSTHFNVPAFVLNQKIRRAILISYQAAVLITVSVLLGLSEHFFLEGQEVLSDHLWVAGFAFEAAAGALLPLCTLIFFFHHFKQASTARLEVIRGSDVRTDKKETKLLLLTVDKIRKAFYFMFPGTTILAIFSTLLASYPNLFFDLPISKAACVILYLVEVLATLLTIQFVRSDIIKLHTNKEGTSEDSQSNRRAESRELSPRQSTPKTEEDAIDHFLEVAKSSEGNQ